MPVRAGESQQPDRSGPPPSNTLRAVDGVGTYDAFISYCRADAAVAQKLQAGLQTFAKPWYRLRALRVFRDDAVLTANAGLWHAIEQALDESRWLILLASGESAKSIWVQREVSHWCSAKGADQLLIVLTDRAGGADGLVPRWDGSTGDFDWEHTTGLPTCLRGVFAEEPRFVALGWAREQKKLSVRDPLFRAAVADLAAPLRGEPKDSLVGDDIRQHRRLLRLSWSAVVALVALLVISLLLALISVRQRDTARAQRNVAQARLVLASANAVSQTNPRVSLLLTLAAWKAFHLPEARAALEQTAASTHYLATLPTGHNVYSVDFRSDGRLLATAGDDRTASLWRLDSPDHPIKVAALATHTDTVNAVVFSHDGRTLVTGSNDQTAIIWDVANPSSPKPLATLTGHDGGVTAVVLTPDGRTLITGSSDQTAIIWDVSIPRRPRRVATLQRHADVVNGLAVSPDGQTLSTCSGDGTAALWDITDPAHTRYLARTPAGAAGLNAVAFSRDGRTLIAGAADGTSVLWDVADPVHPRRLASVPGGTAAIRALAVDPRGRLLAMARSDGTAIWDIAQRSSPRLVLTLNSNGTPNWSVAFKPGSSVVVTGTGAAGGESASATMWDLGVGSLTSAATLGSEALPVAALSDDATRIMAGINNSGGTRVWSRRSQTISFQSSVGLLDAPEALAFDRGRPILALSTGGEGTVDIWNVDDAAHPVKVSTITEKDGLRTGPIAFGSSGHILAVGTFTGYTDILDLRDPAHPSSIGRLPGTSKVTSLSFSPDGYTIVIGYSDSSVTAWNIRDITHATRSSSLAEHAARVTALAFSSNGHTLASGGDDDSAIIWDVSDIRRPVRLSTLPASGHGITALGFGLNGTLLAIGGRDGTVAFWDLTDPRHPARVTTFAMQGDMGTIAFGLDGRMLLTASAASAPHLWDVLPLRSLTDTGILVDRVCSGAGRNLSSQDWTRYAPDVPYQLSCG